MSTSDNTATDKRDVYARVTAQIITAIEQGVGTWRMPWHTSGRFAFSPINVTSKKPYRGINTVCLWAAAQAKGYERGEWATYQQWQDRGAQVRKGEKATWWCFGSLRTIRRNRRTMAIRLKVVPACCSRAATAYSTRPKWTATRPRWTRTTPTERIAQADAFFQALGPTCPARREPRVLFAVTDHIQMPPLASVP